MKLNSKPKTERKLNGQGKPIRPAAKSEIVDSWFEIQYSLKGADDWFANSLTADTIESALEKLAEARAVRIGQDFDLRIVKKTIEERVVE